MEGGVLSLLIWLLLCTWQVSKADSLPWEFSWALQRFSRLGASPEVADTEAWASPPSALALEQSPPDSLCVLIPHPRRLFE